MLPVSKRRIAAGIRDDSNLLLMRFDENHCRAAVLSSTIDDTFREPNTNQLWHVNATEGEARSFRQRRVNPAGDEGMTFV